MTEKGVKPAPGPLPEPSAARWPVLFLIPTSERKMLMLPAVPPQVYRTERVYRDLLRVFESIDKFLKSGAREGHAAVEAGILDIAAAANELVYGEGALARSQRERRDALVERAREALLPQRKRRKKAEDEKLSNGPVKRKAAG